MKRLAIAATLLVALSVTTFAGEVPTMGKADPQPTPTPTQTTNTTSTSTVSTILLTLISLGLVGR